MARLSVYDTDATVEAGDRVIGTDVSGTLTKNYTVEKLGNFIHSTYGSEGYNNIAFNTSTGVLTMTEVDGGTDTVDLGIGTGDSPTFVGLTLSGNADFNGDLDVDGTSNLDVVDIDGAVDMASTLTLAGNADFNGDLDVDGTTNLDNTDIDGTFAVDGATISLDATTSFNIDNSNTSNGITIGTATSGVPISIGHSTSETTINDNLTVGGDLTVNGDTTTVNTATLSVEDPLMILASGNNSSDTVDIGFYGLYDTSGSQDLYSGLFRDANDSGKWKLFKDLQAAPTTTVNTGGTGYAIGTLVANIEGEASKVTVADKDTCDEYPVVFHDESSSLHDDTGGFEYNPNKCHLHLKGEEPTLYFTDTDTNGDSYISASSSAGSMSIAADYNNEANTTKIGFKLDGKEVGHWRGNSTQIGSLRLFPQKGNNDAQGIFFGTETSEPSFLDWVGKRMIAFDTSETLHFWADDSDGTPTGHLQIASAGGVSAGGDVDVTGSVKCTQNLRRTVTTATESSNTHTCNLSLNDNFNIACNNAATTIALTVASENVGQSGTITIVNPSSVGSLSFVALPSYMLTPDGATVNFVTTANAISMISYYVHATDKVLVNYVGNFA